MSKTNIIVLKNTPFLRYYTKRVNDIIGNHMLKKLLNGEFSLAISFWKYGILGIVFINILIKIFGQLLAQKLKGITVFDYLTKHFNPLNFESSTIVYTTIYLILISMLFSYSYILIVGIWRSSAEYERSVWLRHLSRIIIIILVYISIKNIF